MINEINLPDPVISRPDLAMLPINLFYQDLQTKFWHRHVYCHVLMSWRRCMLVVNEDASLHHSSKYLTSVRTRT